VASPALVGYTRGGGAGCEATLLRCSGRIRRPIPSNTSTPATTPPRSLSRRGRRQGRWEALPGRAAVRWLRAVRFFRLIAIPHVGSIVCTPDGTAQRSRARRLSIACRTCVTIPANTWNSSASIVSWVMCCSTRAQISSTSWSRASSLSGPTVRAS